MSSTGRKITLKSSDGVTFEVDEVVALESQTIKHLIQLIEDGGAVDVIPRPNVTSKILSKVIEYCTKHVEAPKSDDRATSVDDELKTWDAYFVKVDRVTLRELKQAANYLEIKSLLDLMSQTFEDVTLMSSDGKTFEVDKSVALESQTIKLLIEDVGADDVIPLPNVTSKILSKVIEYCKKHVEAPKSDDRATSVDDELKAWDADFVKVDQATLFDLILAANYLNIKSLLDLTCQTVADMIKGKTPEEIRKTFNSKTFNSKDFTPEEEEEVRRENPWAFE